MPGLKTPSPLIEHIARVALLQFEVIQESFERTYSRARRSRELSLKSGTLPARSSIRITFPEGWISLIAACASASS
jgi:hypothetical protein